VRSIVPTVKLVSRISVQFTANSPAAPRRRTGRRRGSSAWSRLDYGDSLL